MHIAQAMFFLLYDILTLVYCQASHCTFNTYIYFFLSPYGIFCYDFSHLIYSEITYYRCHI